MYFLEELWTYDKICQNVSSPVNEMLCFLWLFLPYFLFSRCVDFSKLPDYPPGVKPISAPQDAF